MLPWICLLCFNNRRLPGEPGVSRFSLCFDLPLVPEDKWHKHFTGPMLYLSTNHKCQKTVKGSHPWSVILYWTITRRLREAALLPLWQLSDTGKNKLLTIRNHVSVQQMLLSLLLNICTDIAQTIYTIFTEYWTTRQWTHGQWTPITGRLASWLNTVNIKVMEITHWTPRH